MKDNYITGILIGIFLGICLGFIITMLIVVMDIGKIQENNGLMYEKDCNDNNHQNIYRNLSLWCIDRLKECNDRYFDLLLEEKK